MGELLPVLGGVLAGVLATRLSTPRLRLACIAVLSAAFGVMATLANGEELFLIPVDTGIAAVSACVVLLADHLLKRRVLSVGARGRRRGAQQAVATEFASVPSEHRDQRPTWRA
jgi:hypothetical protein